MSTSPAPRRPLEAAVPVCRVEAELVAALEVVDAVGVEPFAGVGLGRLADERLEAITRWATPCPQSSQ